MSPADRLVVVAAPVFEHHVGSRGSESLGVGESTPRLSWRTTAPSGWQQQRYQIEVRRGIKTELFAPVTSSDSVLRRWPSDPLRSRERAEVRVRVWDQTGEPSEWSAPAVVEAGLLDAADWTCAAISPVGSAEPQGTEGAWLLRGRLDLGRPVARGRLYVSAQGVYEIELNGVVVGDETLAPGWTSYPSRLRYMTHDVTALLRAGENVLGAWLGEGWYRGRLGFGGGHRNVYGDDVALIAQLEITQDDGSVVILGTDERWRSTSSPILSTGLLDGESYDARLEMPGWSSTRYDDAAWQGVRLAVRDRGTLVAPDGPPVRCTRELPPVSVTQAGDGRMIVDFGQNLVGRVRMTVAGQRGSVVTLRHAEVLQDGELCTRPLRGATATDSYVLRGAGEETWEPRFTVHGFRFLEIEGWTGGSIADNLVAKVYHSDLLPTGSFECSDELVNRLHENVVWSMRGNFLDVPTDCPQRDERLGWTGDIQVFGPAASFLFDCSGMLSSWLKDVAAEQLPDGTVPWFVPTIPGGEQWTPPRPGAGWGDAAVLVPWTLYERYGDKRVLERQYESARAWVDLVDSLAGPSGVWDTGYQLGDWLDTASPPDDPAAGSTDRHLIATAYFARSAARLAQIAAVLERPEQENHYRSVANRARQGFRRRYLGDAGRLADPSQAAYSLAIVFDLFETDEERTAAGHLLAALVADVGDHLTTGFLGTPVILDALTSTGQLDTAYRLLMQRECPAWLYPVTMGATTMWERWDSLLPDGTVNPGDMTSFNHYAFGAVADWLHRVVAGIEPAEPGYRAIRFHPRPGGGLTWAAATLETPYGRAAIQWSIEDGRFSARVTAPTGSRAVIQLPDGSTREVPVGTSTYTSRLSSPSPGQQMPLSLGG